MFFLDFFDFVAKLDNSFSVGSINGGIRDTVQLVQEVT